MGFGMLARLAPKRERRRFLLGVAALLLTGCGGGARISNLFSDDPGPQGQQPGVTQPGGMVVLLLPLSASGDMRNIALAMQKAADIAVRDSGGTLVLVTKDTGGTGAGAQAAASQAIAEGAKLLLGPLLAEEVSAVAPLAQSAGINVIAFSSDSAVAGQGTYLMSFLPEEEISAVVHFAASKGYSNVGGLFPESPYGAAAERALARALSANGLASAGAARYARSVDAVAGPVGSVAPGLLGGNSAILIPESGKLLDAIGLALRQNGIDPTRVKVLGTGLWDNPMTRSSPIALGGWYAGVDPALIESFDQKYMGSYGTKPPRLASLSYDAVMLAASLAQTGDFSAAAITSPQGYSSANGLFRFRADGLIERGLAILQMSPGGVDTISRGPTAF